MDKKILILIGILSLSYIIIFLLVPKDITDYTIADTEYWRETQNRLLLKTAYNYNDKDSIASFPKNIGEWKSFDYRYPSNVYAKLNAEILMSRTYSKNNGNNTGSIIWMDIINSKTGESFHKQKLCVTGQGWNIDNDSMAEFRIADPSNPFTTLYVNKLDISKGNKKQVMIYWFMFKEIGDKDAVSMIRLSSPVRNNDTQKTFNLIKGFVENQLFDTMYKGKKEEITVAEDLINKYGNGGRIGIVLGILIPLGIIFVGIRKKI